MATHGTITFDNNPEKVYYAGQVLSGQVDLDLSQPQSVRGMTNDKKSLLPKI